MINKRKKWDIDPSMFWLGFVATATTPENNFNSRYKAKPNT